MALSHDDGISCISSAIPIREGDPISGGVLLTPAHAFELSGDVLIGDLYQDQ